MGYLNLSGLSRFLGKIQGKLDLKLDKAQNANYAGRYVTVGSSGAITFTRPPLLLGIPHQNDSMAVVTIDSSNAGGSLECELWDEDEPFVEDRVYGAQMHVYTGSGEAYSSYSIAIYTAAQGGSDAIHFFTCLMVGNTLIEIAWAINPTSLGVKTVARINGTTMSLSAVLNEAGLTDIALDIWQVQAEPR